MAAKLTTLTTKPERLRRDQADRLKGAFQEIDAQIPLPLGLMREMFSVVAKHTASNATWSFVMVSPNQNAAVIDYLAENSSRPIVAIRLWAMCFKHLRDDTGEILLRRDEFADQLGQTSDNISRIMTELETCGAIIKLRHKMAGMKGPGVVRYFMNPRVATHLAGDARDQTQAAAPPVLTVVPKGRP